MSNQIRYDYSLKNIKKTAKELSGSSELQLILTAPALLKYREKIGSGQNILDLALKATTPLCPRTILLTPSLEEWDAGGFISPQNLGHHFKVTDLAIETENLLQIIASDKATASRVTILPTSIMSYFEDWVDEDNWETSSSKVFDFEEDYKNENGYRVSLSGNDLLHQLIGGNQEAFQTCLVLYITYPEIQNVPANLITRVIEDNNESYKRFQHVINKLVLSKKDLPSGTAVKLAVAELEYEVSRFDAELRAIQKSRAMSSYQAFVGVGLLGLSLFISEELAKYLSAVLGIHGTGALEPN